jgi:acetolactate synthase I/II/III large subunit
MNAQPLRLEPDPSMPFRVADLLADSLALHGVQRAFSVPGESFLPLLDALYGREDFDLMTCRHEGSASLAAAADARLTGMPGVVMVSRGPGLANATIGIHVASQEALPLVVLVGQVDLPNLGRDAVPEIDAARLFGPMAKWTARIHLASQAAETLARAFSTAASGTPGPVIVELPEDLLAQEIPRCAATRFGVARPEPSAQAMDDAAALLARAERPVLIVGGEACADGAFRQQLVALSEAWQLPVAVTNKNQDLFPNTHPHWLGQLGFFPSAVHTALFAQADLVVGIGTRLGDVSTQGFTVPRQSPDAQRLLHVYPDAGAIGRHFATTLGVVSTARAFVDALLRITPPSTDRSEWLRAGLYARDAAHSWNEARVPAQDVLGHVINAVRGAMRDDTILTTDSGNFAAWVHRALRLGPSNRLLGSACGAMGMGVPAGLAAGLRHPRRQVIAFCGDGGFLMSGNELATAVDRGIDLKIVVANNASYGTIRSFQERSYPGRVSGTDLRNPDFAALARAFGASGHVVRHADEAAQVMAEALAVRGPAVIEVRCATHYALADSLRSAL